MHNIFIRSIDKLAFACDNHHHFVWPLHAHKGTHRHTHKRPTLSVNLRINAKPNANEFFMSLCILLSYWKITLFDAVVVCWLFLFGTKQILSHTIAKESILRLHQKYFVSMHCVNRKFLLEKLFHFIEISVPF